MAKSDRFILCRGPYIKLLYYRDFVVFVIPKCTIDFGCFSVENCGFQELEKSKCVMYATFKHSMLGEENIVRFGGRKRFVNE